MTAAGAAPVDRHRALARSSAVNLVGFGAYGLSNFLLVVVITRQLGTTGAGALLTAIALFNIVARSAMAGTDLALVRFASRFLARGRQGELGSLFLLAVRPVLAVSGVAGLALFVLAGPLGRLLASEGSAADLTLYLQVLAPFVPVATVYQVIEGGSRGFGTMVPGVVVEKLARSSLLPVTMLAVTAAGGGVTAIALAWAGPFLVALVPMALWTTALLRRAEGALTGTPAGPGVLDAVLDLRDGAGAVDGPEDLAPLVEPRPAGAADGPPAPIPHPELRRRFWGFALPRSVAGVFALTIMWVDSLLLGALESTEAVGVYTAATRWLIVGNFAGNAVTTAFGPQIAAVLVGDDPGAVHRLFDRAAAWLVLLAWPPYLTAMVFAPFLVGAFGDGFGDGAAVITITGVGFLASAAAGPIDMLLLMAGRSRTSLVNTGVALAVNVGANLALIPLWGVEGAALAWTLSLVVANGLPLVQMWGVARPGGPHLLRAGGVAGGVGLGLVAGRLALGATAGGLALGLALGGAVLVAAAALTSDRLGIADLRRTV